MRNIFGVISSLTLLLIAGGCESAMSGPSAPKAAVAPAPAPAPAAAKVSAPTNSPMPSMGAADIKEQTIKTPSPVMKAPKLSAAANALVQRLTNDNDADALPHEISDTTEFPGAMKSLQEGALAPKIEKADYSSQPPPRGLTADGNSTALIDRDWTGLVLIPISKSLSKAHTSDVWLGKVEAHPLTDGRVRIWTRVQNIGNQSLPAEIACEFRLRGVQLTSPYFYELDVPPNGFRDVFFVSPEGELNSYTVLVRSASSVQH